MINPESRGHRSYYESFVRHHNITPDVLSEEKALTDRGAYLNFLEIQLERVSAACLAGQECSATVDSMSSKISSIDAKVLSATKLVRLAQTYSEEMGSEQAKVNDALEQRLANLEQHICEVGKARKLTPQATTTDANVGVTNCEVEKTEQTADRTSSHHVLTSELPRMPDFLSSWMSNVDRQLKELHDRVDASQKTIAALDVRPAVITRPRSNDDEGEVQENAAKTKLGDISSLDSEATLPTIGDFDDMKKRLRQLEEISATAIHDSEVTPRPEGDRISVPSNSRSPRRKEADAIDEAHGIEQRFQRLEEISAEATHEMRGVLRQESWYEDKESSGPPGHAVLGTIGETPAAEKQLQRPNSTSVEALGDSKKITQPKDGCIGEVSAEISVSTQGAEELTSNDPGCCRNLRPGGENTSTTHAMIALVLDALEKGSTEAVRAREAAEEALRIGKEAAERSERTENLAKTMAARSIKFAREQQSFVSDAVGRLNRKLRQHASDGDEDRIYEGVTAQVRPGPSRRDPAGDCIVQAEEPSCRGKTACDSGALFGVEGLPRERALDVPGNGNDKPPMRRGDEGRRAREAVHRQEIRGDLDGLPGDEDGDDNGDNGRRITLARTALGSVLRKSSPGQHNHVVSARSEEARELGQAGRKRGADGGKVDELREAVSGAVDILSGLDRCSESCLREERRHQLARCPRRDSRSASATRLSRTRECMPNSARRDPERLTGYWIPPGNIPSKLGERTRVGACVRVPWDGDATNVEDTR